MQLIKLPEIFFTFIRYMKIQSMFLKVHLHPKAYSGLAAKVLGYKAVNLGSSHRVQFSSCFFFSVYLITNSRDIYPKERHH